MNEMKVARGLGWFSIGLGLTEIVAGRQLCRTLGMPEDRDWVFRAYGVREIAAGVRNPVDDQPQALGLGPRGGGRPGRRHRRLRLFG